MRRRQMYAMSPIQQMAADDLGAAIAPRIEELTPDKHECPKCGRIVKQGMFMHKKYCQGK